MTSHGSSLDRRRDDLLLRSAAQREALSRLAGDLVQPIRSIDRSVGRGLALLRHPATLGTVLLVAVAIGRGRTLRSVGAGLALIGSVTRWAGLLAPQQRSPGIPGTPSAR